MRRKTSENKYYSKQVLENMRKEFKKLYLKFEELTQTNKQLIVQNTALKYDYEVMQKIVNKLVAENIKVMHRDFKGLSEHRDIARCSFKTIIYNLECIYFYVKLFEMNVFDFIVDRQSIEKTDKETMQLISESKVFTNKILLDNVFKGLLDLDKFKKDFKHFAKDKIEFETVTP